jgi:glycosyltransferase involved in cell wall biosynthesis
VVFEMKLPISAIILTYNEEINLEQCLKNIADWVGEIIIIDSFSTDKTLEIAKKYKAKVFKHEFVNQAQQFNWALDNVPIKNDWIFRLDADEWVTPELWREIERKLQSVSGEVSGYCMKRRVYFMGRWIKHGGYYPTWLVRLFRKGMGKSEYRKMDEHIVVEGNTEKLQNDFVDENHKGLTFWIEKHRWYATREAEQVMEQVANDKRQMANLDEETKKKRKMKSGYYKLPLFLRAFLYFFYRYFIRLGFLDGKEGFVFHILQGFWYRFLVDAEIYELHKKNK